MVLVLRRGRFKVYVYDETGGRHHLPHCNVRWSDGNAQVSLPDLDLLAGTPLPRAALELVFEGLDELIGAWDTYNPTRKISDDD